MSVTMTRLRAKKQKRPESSALGSGLCWCLDCSQPIIVETMCGYTMGTRCGCPEKHYAVQDEQTRRRLRGSP